MKSMIVHPTDSINAEIFLASSKSESNRALIINALTGFEGKLENISSARDTQTMLRLLQSAEPVADVLDAGTTMRFLTAYFAITGQQKTMTGTARMCERPIGILVDALRQLGAKIEYTGKEGFPPLSLKGFDCSGNNQIVIRGDVSSQYISALLMIGPMLPDGIELTLTGEIGSIPYIQMTLEQMKAFGVNAIADWINKKIIVPSTAYQPTTYQIESDWSGASYWYSLVAIAPEAEIELIGLKSHSLQGDSAIVQIMENLGVKSEFTSKGVKLTKIPHQKSLSWDFANCPDLVQTVAVCCVMKGIELTLTGIESLKIKETDRVLALQTELPKIGGELVEIEQNQKYVVRTHKRNAARSQAERRPLQSGTPPAPNFKLQTSNSEPPSGTPPAPSSKLQTLNSEPPTQNSQLGTRNSELGTQNSIHTYDDHRMAMAFAPVGAVQIIEILEPQVVAKSYPSFWDDFKKVGLV